jgi:hypothetical protein
MSNRASLRRTTFTGDGGDVGWGWRICDDHFRSYADDCEEQDMPKDPLQLLSKACAEAAEQERLLFEDLLAGGKGLLIDGSWHEFEEIAPALRAILGKED